VDEFANVWLGFSNSYPAVPARITKPPDEPVASIPLVTTHMTFDIYRQPKIHDLVIFLSVPRLTFTVKLAYTPWFLRRPSG
jgi:hypothetical protein